MSFQSFVMFFWTVFWAILGMIAVLVDPTGKIYSILARKLWSPQILWIGGIKATVKGGENLDLKRPYVVCANHQSQVDIPLLFANLKVPIRFLAKRSLFFIPVFGWALFLARYIPIDRSSKKSARRSIERGAMRIKKGPSLAVFPEGTRSPDGKIHQFKSGAFVMAIMASVPVLPVAIRGSYHIVPKTTVKVQPGKVEVVIGDPISTEGVGMDGKEALKKKTRDAIVAMFETGEPYREKAEPSGDRAG